MSQEQNHSNIIFCNDAQLWYDDYATEFADGQGLLFDDAYRLAHLPLVAPNHPRVISMKPGTSYNRGVHDLTYSIALPVRANELLVSEEFKRLCDELRATTFAHKLSWSTFAQRKNKLHATICGAISIEDAPRIEPHTIRQLRQIGPISIKIRGLFSGNLNIGRLYLKVYPEQRGGKNMLHVIQEIFDSALTNLYVVGLFNFVEELTMHEAQELSALLDRWRDTEIVQLHIQDLWLLKSSDDLVLDGGIEQTIPIV